MPLSGLTALLGLSGGAQGVAQGLNQWGAKRQQQDDMAQRLEIAKAQFAAQMAASGYQVQPPSGRASIATPTASSGSHADMHAHAPSTPPTPSVPEITNEQFGYSPTLDAPDQQPQPPMQAPQMARPPAMQQPAPQQQGSALASLIAPQSPGITAFGQQYQRPADYKSPQEKAAELAEQYRVLDENRKRAAAVPTKVKVVQPDGTVAFVDPNNPPEGLKERGPAGPAPTMHEVTAPDGSKSLQPVTPGMTISPPTKVAVKPLAAPISFRVSQHGEMLKKAQDLLPAMEKLQVSLGQSAGEDIAEHGIHVPLLGAMPGSRGVGSIMVNRSPDYAAYQAALVPWVLAAGHASAGLRVSEEQLRQIRNSVEIKPGDFNNPSVMAIKTKNMIDMMNSIGGSLPADAITEQEDQMGPDGVAGLVVRGYKSRKAGGTSTPTEHGKVSDADFARAWQAGKRTDADIAAWVTANPKKP